MASNVQYSPPCTKYHLQDIALILVAGINKDVDINVDVDINMNVGINIVVDSNMDVSINMNVGINIVVDSNMDVGSVIDNITVGVGICGVDTDN